MPADTDDADRALARRVARILDLDEIERRCARALSRFPTDHPTARAELAALLGGVDSVRRWLQVEPGEPPAPSAPRYFSYDCDNGYEEHDTAEQARAEAERALDWHRDQARYEDGWSEDVTSVCWGEVLERVAETDRGETDGDEEEGIEPETWADYGLVPVAGVARG